MTEELKLEILPNGHLRFNRGNKEYNEKMKEIIFPLIDDEKVIEQLEEFFKGSEETELLIGGTIFCG